MKLFVFRLLKCFGFFALARYLTDDNLRIICYHGFSIGDEHKFRPSLFMAVETFERRLKYLSENGYNVIDLDSALEDLRNNDIKPSSVVITIDDGFYSVYSLAFPLLKKYKYPSTLYVTTYYVEHSSPIFRIALQYLFWKTSCNSASLSSLVPGLPEICETKGKGGYRNLWTIIDYAEQQLDEEDRDPLLDNISEELMIDFSCIREKRLFNLVTSEEIETMQRQGINIQLHTHRHRIPDEEDEFINEIEKNREALGSSTNSTLNHFCYPSGVWSKRHWPVLSGLGIETAATCEPGLNKSGAHPLALNRYLDRDDFSDIEFEAEISGFKEILRRFQISARMKPLRVRIASSTE